MQMKKPKEKKPEVVKIGLRIQQARNERGMTQEQFASQVGRNTNCIGNLENGRSCPSVKLLILLAKALDVSVDSLLRDDPDINPTYPLNPEMEKRSREMPQATRITCLAMMDQLIEVQNNSLEAGRKAQANEKNKNRSRYSQSGAAADETVYRRKTAGQV